MPRPLADIAVRLVAAAGWLALVLAAGPADAAAPHRGTDTNARVEHLTTRVAGMAAQERVASADRDGHQRDAELWRQPTLLALVALHRADGSELPVTVPVQRLRLIVPTLLAGWREREAALAESAAARDGLRERIAILTSWRGLVANLTAPAQAAAIASRGWAGRYGRGPGRAGTPSEANIAFFTPPASGLFGPTSSRAMPVAGIVVAAFNEDVVGGQHRGVVIAPSAVQGVRAPASGRVAFAGPFKGFGLLLIIAHGDGYHSLISGLREVDVAEGDLVVPGQVVGALQIRDGRPAPLYVELRRHGRPVDPLPWFAGGEEKVSG